MFPVSDVIPSRTFPAVTIGLIVVNALVFLYSVTLPDPLLNRFIYTYALIPAHFSWASAITSMFLHGSWGHIIGNMLFLWIFGDNVEDRMGHVAYLIFYLAAGTIAALVQTATATASTIPMLGASGAIAAVMGAYFVLYPQSRVLTAVFLFFFFDLVEIPAIFFLGIWFVMQLFSGVGSIASASQTGGVAFWAHIGGFVTGALAGTALRLRRPRWDAEWH